MSEQPAIPVPFNSDIKGMTKGEICERLKQGQPGMDYDTAMPQDLVNSLMEMGFDARPKCFMLYLTGSVFGQIHGLTVEYHEELHKYLRLMG